VVGRAERSTGRGRATPALLEREAALAALADALADARDGEGRLLVVEGSAGIGKSRLLAEARTLAVAAGMQVLSSRAGEHETEFPFGIVRQLFEPLLVNASAKDRSDRLAGAAALVEPLFVEVPSPGHQITEHGDSVKPGMAHALSRASRLLWT
jgi:hypothetical protein